MKSKFAYFQTKLQLSRQNYHAFLYNFLKRLIIYYFQSTADEFASFYTENFIFRLSVIYQSIFFIILFVLGVFVIRYG